MLGAALKSILPRSLYWRAMLILILPVVVLLLVVSVFFIQRHYEGVTRQMTENFAAFVGYLHDQVEAEPDSEDAAHTLLSGAEALGLSAELLPVDAAPPVAEFVPFYNINGRLVLHHLGLALPEAQFLGFVDGQMQLHLTTRHGLVSLRFPLRLVSARNPHQLLVAMLLSGILMSIISLIFLKNQIRSISRLARAAEAFGRGQSLPYHPSGAAEVRAAGRAFVEMRRRIERHIEQRTLMLSGVSHDLRTPLTRMKLALSMLDNEPEATALLGDVQEMEGLIDRFLEFARAEGAEEAVETDLRALVAHRVAEAGRAGRAVFLRDGADLAPLALRPAILSRALDNLIGNAVRYGSRTELWLEERDGEVTVVVEDDGPGIEPAQRERALRPFVRLDAARGATGGSGAGLGLAIAADAMRAHGGRLELAQGRTPGLGGLEARLIMPRAYRRGAGRGKNS